MKKLSCICLTITILLIFLSYVSSCTKKTETKPESVANRLFEKQWIVDSLFNNYTGSNTGTLVYVRGGSNNSQNLDDAIVVMLPNGQQQFHFNGADYNYTYSFQNSDSTELLIHNPNADYARIVNLTDTHLTVYDSTHSALSYYVYKP